MLPDSSLRDSFQQFSSDIIPHALPLPLHRRVCASEEARRRKRTRRESEVGKRCSLSDDESCLSSRRAHKRSDIYEVDGRGTRKEYDDQRWCAMFVSSRVVHVTHCSKKRRMTTVSNQSMVANRQPEKSKDLDSVHSSPCEAQGDIRYAQGSGLHWLRACAWAYDYFCSSDRYHISDQAGRVFCDELNSREHCGLDPPLCLLQGPTALYIPEVVNPTQAATVLLPCAASLRAICGV